MSRLYDTCSSSAGLQQTFGKLRDGFSHLAFLSSASPVSAKSAYGVAQVARVINTSPFSEGRTLCDVGWSCHRVPASTLDTS
ncbi:Protein of unknown function [Pyronema omphalodes CBS 100304]|uniref:Uncharacterized protein n=1 Tax=Pyronema omphalodes (strain CBS 100304) TaxID=1076935 RepID=U4KX43_PYROM|nr:Protein of unknown function [Pyronema omphalodes CBS 100304]